MPNNTVSMQDLTEMKTKKEKKPKLDEAQTAQDSKTISAESDGLTEDVPSELKLPLWSIVTFEDVAVRGLSYDEALKWLEKLEKQNISGLCIVDRRSRR